MIELIEVIDIAAESNDKEMQELNVRLNKNIAMENHINCANELIALNNEGDNWDCENIIKLLRKYFK